MLTNYIEFENIDDPFKSHILTAERFKVDLETHKASSKIFKLKRNSFKRMDKMF